MARSTSTPPLRVNDITVDFGGLRALNNVTLEVDEGAIIGLIGPNGAGKTTLFDCVHGIVQPTKGAVQLFGQNVTSWPVHRRARLGLGRTFQRLELFGSLSVEENVIVALESVSSVGNLANELLRRPAAIDVRTRALGRAHELLELVGITEHAGSRAADLPMGLSRLLELARSLATEPKLLLLDEPSSGLNDEETEQLGAIIERLQRERKISVLVVEHDMQFVLGISKHVYVLEFGRVIAHGTPAQIRKDKAVRAAYLGQEVRA